MDDEAKKHANRRKKVYYHALAMGLPHEDCEEIQQEFEVSRLEGKAAKQKALHFVIDQLRLRGFDQSQGMPSIHDARRELKTEPSEWSNPITSIRIREALKGYSLEERVIIILENVWGLTPQEISFVIGASEWRTKEKMKLLHREL